MDSSAACLSESIIFKGLDAQFSFLLEEGALLVAMEEAGRPYSAALGILQVGQW